MSKNPSKETIEAKVRELHDAAVGKVFAAKSLRGYLNDDSHELVAPEGRPFKVRVRRTEDSDLIRWLDDDHCDPYWDVALVEPHPDVPEGMSSLWVDGLSPTDSEVTLEEIEFAGAAAETETVKAALTAEDIREYVTTAYGHCPFCDDHSIEGSSFDFEANYVSQEVYCHACGAAWQDIYELKAIEVRELPDKHKPKEGASA